MFPSVSYVAAKEYHQDLLREAERERLAYAAVKASGRQGVMGRILRWMGERMVAWGQALEARYATIPDVPRLAPSHCGE